MNRRNDCGSSALTTDLVPPLSLSMTSPGNQKKLKLVFHLIVGIFRRIVESHCTKIGLILKAFKCFRLVVNIIKIEINLT